MAVLKINTRVKAFTEQSAYYWNEKPKIIPAKKELSKEKPVVVELFAGLGGTSMGFEMAGFETAVGLDIHEPSSVTFSHAHPTATTILGDITNILALDEDNSQSILKKEVEKRLGDRKVDVLIAGIPCQGFSLANRKRTKYDKRNYLFYYFREAVRLLNPSVVMLENVSGLRSLSNGDFVNSITKVLKKEGYKVTHKILNAADYGVPQKRRRIVFLGHKKTKIELPEPIYSEKEHLTVQDAIGDLPSLNPAEMKNKYENKPKTKFQRLMRGNQEELFNHEAPNHPDSVIDKIKNTVPGDPMYPKYKQRIRLNWKDSSPTQVCGGIRPQFQFGHPEDTRGLSVRERARIQSIPDSVKIFGGLVQGRVQTGNAVPPLLAKAVAEKIKEVLQND